MSELVSNGVQIYQFPTEDEAVAEINSSMNVRSTKTHIQALTKVVFNHIFDHIVTILFQSHLPFAVVGSLEDIKVGNKMVKARLYPWGSVQGECGELYLTSII